MLGVAAATRGDSERQVGGGEVGGGRPQGPHAQPAAVHQWWRERMIGVPDAASVTRIRRWMHDIHAKARASGIWQRLWLPLVAFNCVHVVWPVLLAAQQVQAGTLGTATLLLTIPQSVASGYLWNNALRLSMLAVMHFARMRSIAQQVLQALALAPAPLARSFSRTSPSRRHTHRDRTRMPTRTRVRTIGVLDCTRVMRAKLRIGHAAGGDGVASSLRGPCIRRAGGAGVCWRAGCSYGQRLVAAADPAHLCVDVL